MNALRQRLGSPRGVAWLGGIFIAAVLALALHDLWRGRAHAAETTRRELDAQARVLAEQAARSVQAVDVVLRHLAAEHARGALDGKSPEQLHALLREQAIGLRQAEGLTLHDAQGRPRALSWRFPAPDSAYVGDRPNFQRVRNDPAAALMIGGTVRSRVDESVYFPIFRRLLTADGQFAGVASARGRIAYFEQFYRDVQPDPHTRIALLHRDSTLLARHPPAPETLGRPVPELAALLANAGPGTLSFEGPSPIDGVHRFASVRLVPDYPLVIVVSRDSESALAAWRTQAWGSAGRTLALAALAAALLAIVLRQLRRLQAAGASLAVSQERYALAAAGADDGIWDWDLVAGSAYESARARQLQGLPLQPETQPLADLQALFNVHPDDAPVRSARMQAHLDGATPAYEVEYRVRRDGDWRWIRVRAMCVRDAAGRALRIAGSVSDVDARRRAEEELRASEQRYALAMTGSSGGYWVWEVKTDAIFASGTVHQLFGVPPDRAPATRAAYFALIELHPDDRERIALIGRELLDGRRDRADFEYRILLPGSRAVRWILNRSQCFRAADGSAERMAGISVDITERKLTEEALRASEERFALAVAGTQDGIYDWDLVHDRMYSSPRASQILGMPAEPDTRPRAEWAAMLQVHPDDEAVQAQMHRRRLAGETGVLEAEFRIRRPDGRWRWVRVRGRTVFDAGGHAVRWVGSLTDIDDERRTAEALRRSEERYQLAVDGSNQGLWDWDLASDMLYLSPRAQRLNFLEPGEPLRPRREWVERTLYHPDDVAKVRHAIASHLRGETAAFDVEYRVRHHSGAWHWYRQRGLAVRDAGGRPYRMAGSMEDISERKLAEGQRDRLELQLRQAQKLEAIGTLAGGIAHDFNNILAAILGYGELAQKDAPEGTPLRRHLDAALSAGLRAKSLVERILAFSRSGMSERVPVHVQAVVEEALGAVGAALPPEITLEHRLAAGDAGVLGDATQIHQVVLNLCANAAQAMRAGGRLTVALDCPRLDAPLATATRTLPAGDYVRLEVADTGTGIAAEVLERIFDPFFTTKQVGVGTGLGLSLVHGIVTDLGGGIAVDSRPGSGASFGVWLPRQGDAAAPAAADELPLLQGAGETVLLVDDEEPLVRLGEELLAGLGYEPVGFASSVAALEAFRAEPGRFDAVLSDEAMPGMTGSELALQLRTARPELPVVLMSGFVSPALVARARDAGVVEVLAKPLVARDIARGLAAALRRGLPPPRS